MELLQRCHHQMAAWKRIKYFREELPSCSEIVATKRRPSLSTSRGHRSRDVQCHKCTNVRRVSCGLFAKSFEADFSLPKNCVFFTPAILQSSQAKKPSNLTIIPWKGANHAHPLRQGGRRQYNPHDCTLATLTCSPPALLSLHLPAGTIDLCFNCIRCFGRWYPTLSERTLSIEKLIADFTAHRVQGIDNRVGIEAHRESRDPCSYYGTAFEDVSR